MRNFTYKILCAIVVFMAGIAGLNAQNSESLIVKVIGDFPDNNNGYEIVYTIENGNVTLYHGVNGSEAKLNFSLPKDLFHYSYVFDSGEKKEIREDAIDSENNWSLPLYLQDNNNKKENQTYTFYAKNKDTETEYSYTIEFVVYKAPEINDIKLSSEQKYYIKNPKDFGSINLTYNPEIPWGNNYVKEEWKCNMDDIDKENIIEGTYSLPLNVDAGEYIFNVKLSVLAPDGNTIWRVLDSNTTTITIFEEPTAVLIPASPYAIVNGNAIDVRLVLDDVNDPSMQKPDEIQISTAEWDGATKDINNELLASFNPKDETVGNKVITTKVEWYYMDGDNKIPLYNKTLIENKGAASIQVYATPSVKLTPVSPYAIVGGTEIDVTLDFTAGTDSALQGVENSSIKIETDNWLGAVEQEGNELSASFNPSADGINTGQKNSITTAVTWYYVEGTKKINLYTKELNDIQSGAASIMVYAAPNYKLNTEEIYYSFVEVEIPISSFVTSVEGINSDKITESIFLTVDTDTPRNTYIPTTTANKEIKLNVQYKHGETILYDREKKYTINIIENPNWQTNFKDIFGTNSDGDEDDDLHTTQDLLCNGGKELQVKLDNCVDGISYDAKCSYGNNITREFSNSDVKTLRLSDICEELQKGENRIQFTFSYSVEPLLDLEKNNKLLTKTTNKHIIVWDNIEASLPKDFSNQFYTRVGDGKIDGLKSDNINLSVNGGDPELWTFELLDTDSHNVLSNDDYTFSSDNKSVKINIDYGRLKFTDEGVKVYQLYAKYVDGITEIGTTLIEITINVYPEPKLDDLVVGLLGDKGVTYNPVNENYDYDIKCYEGDVIKLSSSSNTSNTSNTSSTSSWKYKVGNNTDMQDITWDNNISFTSGDEIGTIEFYSYLNDSKERLVKTINLQVEYVKSPTVDINHELPDVREENKAQIPDLWKNTSENKRLDLYAGWEDLKLEFMPQNGYDEGWTYNWKLDGNDVSYEKVFDYELKDPTDSADGYEERVISFTYTNSIPASKYQERENVGLKETRSYYVRVWRKAEMPNKITLKDDYNVAPDHINDNKAIRVGNKLSLSVSKIKYGYNPQGEGSYNEYTLKENDRELKIESKEPDTLKSEIGRVKNDKPDNGLGSGKNTYKFSFSNKGPRDIPWEEDSITETITVYNRPKTPSSLIRKGNGNSGTLIITYDDEYMNMSLLKPEDYSVVFVCEDTVVIKVPKDENDRHWITTGLEGITINDMSDAYAYTCLNYTKDNGWEQNVRITSGRIIKGDIVESWDESVYNLTDEQMAEARARTRAGGGDYTAIQSVESEEEMVSVYNTSGVKVATSTENLKPGIYIIRSMQNGEMNSKKLSVK